MAPNTTPYVQPSLPWHEEIVSLLAKPVVAGQGAYREGRLVGVQITPQPRQGHTTIAMLVSLFPCYLPQATPEDSKADRIALTTFLEELQQSNAHIRAAACQALGQLGLPEARAALSTAMHDASRFVRAAATQALLALDTPRLRREDLTGLPVVLWQQVNHLGKRLGVEVTNQRGQVRFAEVPAEAVCRLQLLLPGVQTGEQQSAFSVLHLAAQKKVAEKQGTARIVKIAAQGSQKEPPSLPQSYTQTLEDGRLIVRLYQNNKKQVLLEVRSDALRLREGGTYITVMDQQTGEEVWHTFVLLEPDPRGVFTGEALLSDVLDLGKSYKIHVMPVPAPRWD
jgi:hypothetical protein